MRFERAFAMPSKATFSMQPVARLIERYAKPGLISVDPFAGSQSLASYTNDIDPSSQAAFHDDAEIFLRHLAQRGVAADVGFFDPPYSPRQISEHYRAAGRAVTASDTQNAALYRRVRDALHNLIRPNGVVLSFGWNSTGMGSRRGYSIEEILMVHHGGAHNDTICLVERLTAPTPTTES